MDRLRECGMTMIYISHSLGDVLRLCDDLVVLRDGAVVSAGPRADFTLDQLVTHMVGRSLSQWFPARTGRPAQQLSLEARSLSHAGVVRDVSFGLRRGEVLGLAGLLGAGRSELARILFGLEPCARGEVWLDGQPLRGGPRQRIARGLAFLTDDRRADGLCLEASLADNIALASLRDRVHTIFRLVRTADHFAAVAAMRQAVRLTVSARDQQPVTTLSGGNQQKVVLAKWLLARPRVLILDEPTRGIDVGAKQEIYQLIVDLADRGSSVLLISSELEELIGLCDRILVMSGGEIRDCLRREEFDCERILRHCAETAVAESRRIEMKRFSSLAVNQLPLLLFLAVVAVFGWLSPQFLSPANFLNILVQASSSAIVAIGVTFVLLTAGVDLSVGAIMFLAVALGGKLARMDAPLWQICGVIGATGLLFGGLNAVLVARVRLTPFIVTLATLYVGRGLALRITETRAMNMPDSILQLNTARVAGVPLPIIVFLVVLLLAHWVLTETPFGRQVYAVGSDPEAARKAGIAVPRILTGVYLISGSCEPWVACFCWPKSAACRRRLASSANSRRSPRPCWAAPVCLEDAAAYYRARLSALFSSKAWKTAS